VNIARPSINKEQYVNRHNRHSINTQVVCILFDDCKRYNVEHSEHTYFCIIIVIIAQTFVGGRW
jgi:hypothetical protein